MAPDHGARYTPTDRVALQRVDEELVLLDLESGEFFVARGLAPIVWKRLADGHSTARIAEEVAGRYDRDVTEVRRDIDAFVASLVDRLFLARRENG